MSNLRRLRTELRKCYSLDELQILCFDLDIDSDSVPGRDRGIDWFVTEFLDYVQRRGMIPELLVLCCQQRPHENWGSVFREVMQLRESSDARPTQARLPSIVDAMPMLTDIIAHSEGIAKLQIISATGATTWGSLLPQLIQVPQRPHLHISIYICNPEEMTKPWFADHWSAEAMMVVDRIRRGEVVGDDIRIKLYLYDNMPAIHGLMINDEDLIIGFFGWREVAGVPRLAGAERPHLYYNRADDGAPYFFDLFEDWLANCPKELVYSSSERET